MADEAGKTPDPAAPAAADDGTQPQAGTPGAPDGAGDGASASVSLEEARKLRSEAKSLRDRLKVAEDAKKLLEDKDMDERQKLDRDKSALSARVSQLESDLRDKSVQIVAAKVGIKADLIDTIAPLIDWEDVDADDPKAVEKAVKELVKDRPSLSGKPEGMDGGGGRANGGRGAGEGATLTELLLQKTGRA